MVMRAICLYRSKPQRSARKEILLLSLRYDAGDEVNFYPSVTLLHPHPTRPCVVCSVATWRSRYKEKLQVNKLTGAVVAIVKQQFVCLMRLGAGTSDEVVLDLYSRRSQLGPPPPHRRFPSLK